MGMKHSVPEADDPQVYVNFQAFMAALWAIELWGPGEAQALYAMRDAFEESSANREKWEADSYTMAAAQWILFYGQGIFKMILNPAGIDSETDTVWRFGRHFSGSEKLKPGSVERWRFWQSCFDAAAKDDSSSKECQDLARRAADLMDAIAKSMLFL